MDLRDDTEIKRVVLIEGDDNIDPADRAQLDAALRASKAELARGEVIPFDQALGEI